MRDGSTAPPTPETGDGAAFTVARNRQAIYAAVYGDVAITLMKLAAAWYTGSSAMLSETVHSLADVGVAMLLLYGLRRGARPRDELHPFGYGREIYFWSFIVALLVFALGAGVAVYGGLARVLHPEPINNPAVSYIVLGLSFMVEGAAWLVAFRVFRLAKGELGYLEAMQQSKDPNSFTVLLMNSADLAGLIIATIGIYASVATGVLEFDGAASIGIGALLCATAIFLAYETTGLLIGEHAHPALARSIRRIAAGQAGVRQVNALFAVHVGPQQVVALLNVGFAEPLTAREVERAVELIEQQIKSTHPEVEAVFVKPQSAAAFRRAS